MKITIIADAYGVQDNGTGTAVRNLANAMIERGHKVTIVSPYEGEDKSGIKYIQVKSRHFNGLAWYVRKNGVVMGKPEKDKIVRGIVDADVVHLMVPFKMAKATIPLLRQLNIPYTAATHFQPENLLFHLGLGHCTPLCDIIYRRCWKKFYQYVEFVHVPTQFMVDILKRNKYTNQFRVITNGVRSMFKYEPQEKPEQYKGKFIVLSTGRFSGEKRQDLIIKAVKHCKHSDEIQLICCGQGPKEAKLKKMAKGLKNPAFFGYLDYDDFVKTMNTADLCVHASEAEIECLSCTEAMVCGRPCVMSDSKTSAAGGFARDESCLFREGDYRDLADKIDYWFEHDEERRALGEWNRKYAEENLNIDRAMDKMEAMFFEAIDFYKTYYGAHPDGGVHGRFEMASKDHVVEGGHSVMRERVDENYKYIHQNVFWRMYSNFLRGLARVFVPPFTKMKYGYKVRDVKKIKKVRGRGAMIVANHAHVMDACLICTRMVGMRKTRFVMLAEILSIPLAGKLVVGLGGHPIADTVAGARKSHRVLCDTLKKNKLLVIFPEASLHPYCTNLREFNEGAFRIAFSNKAPVVPFVITFKQKQTKKKVKSKMYITTLDPIEPNLELKPREGTADMLERTRNAMQQAMDEFYKQYPLIQEVR